MKSPLANAMKASILSHYTFLLGAELVCTELWTGYGIGDVIVMDKKGLVIEIEIKISKYDLYHELKKGLKRSSINNEDILIEKHKNNSCNNAYTCVPNKYYFCVPKDILDATLQFAPTLNEKYGVILYDPSLRGQKKVLQVKKKARKLHDVDVTEYYRKRMIDRICNDLCAMYKRMYL